MDHKILPLSQVDYYMQLAIDVASSGGTPYGCVIVHRPSGNHVSAANVTSSRGKTAHAEMQALRQLPEMGWLADDLTLITTGEPCPMCMAAIVWCGITQVYYGLSITQIMDYHRQIDISAQEVADRSWIDVTVIGGIKEVECVALFEAAVS